MNNTSVNDVQINENNQKITSNPSEVTTQAPQTLNSESWARQVFNKTTLALCVIIMGVMAYGEVELEWYNSYAKYIAGMSNFNVSILVALSTIVGTLFYLIWGTISDNLRTKYGRRVPMIFIGSIGTVILMIGFVSNLEPYWIILFGGILIPIFSNMVRAARMSIVPDMIPKEKRGQMNTIFTIASNVGSLIIWLPALILLPGDNVPYSYSVHINFIIIGAVMIILTGLFAFFFIKEPIPQELPHTWTHDLRALFDREELTKNKDFLKIFFARMILNASQSTILPFLLIIFQELPLSTTELLIAIPFLGISVGIGFYFVGAYTDVLGRKKITMTCTLILPIGCTLIAFGSINWVIILGYCLMMPFFLGMWIAVDSWMQDLLPEASRGRFLGFNNIGMAIGGVIGVLIGGYVADIIGVLGVFFVSGMMALASVPIFAYIPETLKLKKKN